MALELSREADLERTRIARGLHDDLGQTLVVLKLRLAELAQTEPDESRTEMFREVADMVDEVVDASRSLTFSLAAPLVPGIGIEFELEQVILRLAKLGDFQWQFQADPAAKPLDTPVAECLLRVANELLLNVVKHAHADSVIVELSRCDHDLQLVISDDGVGFEPAPASRPERVGLGLLIMSERLHEVGGHATIDSVPGRGTRVVIVAPLANEE